jgi:hypothetical protein
MVYTFFDESTGLFADRIFSGPPQLLVLNTPTGHKPVRGRHDMHTQRVDVDALRDGGKDADPVQFVVPYTPPAEVTAARLQKEQVQQDRARTNYLETKQNRAVREALLKLMLDAYGPDDETFKRLKAVEDEISPMSIRQEIVK